jgi:aminopeptidase YwaD
MKASQSVQNYPSKLRESTNFSVRTIKQICKNIGPRAPGSENEKKAQEFLAGEMMKCCDTVSIEEFPVHPNAFLGWVRICALLMSVAAVAFNLGFALVSLVLTLLAVSLVVGEFVLYKEMIDPFYKKKISRNAIGVRNPTGELKRRIIFSGHCDSSKEWTFAHLGGPKLLISVLLLSVVGFLFGLAFSIVAVVRGFAFSFGLFAPDDKFVQVLGYIFLALIPVFFVASFFENRKITVMGANDNLTGSLASVAVARFMQDNNIRFENTEVRIVVTGSEEAGLRGAKDYCKKHLTECQEIETVFCSADTLKDLDYIAIYNRDLTGTVKHCTKACALLKKGGENAGVDLPYKTVTLGASDSAAVTQAGINATTLAAMDPAPARYYHTRNDTDALLELKSVETGLNILLETAFLFDEQGLKDSY